MQSRARGNRHTVIYTPLAWAAGVLDAGGKFTISLGVHGDYARVRLSANPETLVRFCELLAMKVPKGASMPILARDQERVIGKLLPYMQTQVTQASAVYKFRVTAPLRKVGWHTTTQVRSFRHRLKESVK